MQPLILLCNDDGVEAPGLAALRQAAQGLGEVWTVAPATEQSARSHAFTMDEPLRLTEHGPQLYSVSGTPADSMYIGIHHVVPRRPAVVLSGINRGANLATDVFYSGTVAAAREACTADIPAIAMSLVVHAGRPPQWETAQQVTRIVAAQVLANGLPHGVLLNVNVPDVAPGELRGIRVAAMGRRYYRKMVTRSTDPRGRPYFWIGGPHDRFEDRPDTDGPLCEAGYAVVTPLTLDLTADHMLPTLADWKF